MKPIPCFDEAFDKSKPYTVFDEGLRVVEVAAIIGSVDKCHELDEQFRPINRSDRKELFRSEQITAAAENVEFFPPIEVYKFRDNYFVVDGHRRVRAAKELESTYLDAYVKVFVLQEEQERIEGIRAKRKFETESGIATIRLEDERFFTVLLKDLREYSGGRVTKEKTKAWKSERYLPISSAIERSKLMKLYPELSPGDIYALMIDFFNNYLTGFPYDEPKKDVISTYLLARGLAKKRPSGTFLRGWNRNLIHNRPAHRNLRRRRVKRRSIYLLCISDHIDPLIHSKSLRNNYRHIDIILSAGDLPFSYYDFIVSSLNKPLLFVFGNHHLEEIEFFRSGGDPLTACGEFPGKYTSRHCGATYIDGKVKRVKGVIVGGLGGSMRYNDGAHQFTNLKMTMRVLRMIPKLLLNRIFHGRYIDILLTHAPPKGVQDGEDLCHRGFAVFNWFIKTFQPDYLIHGHIHLYNANRSRQTGVGQTTVLNAYDHAVIEISV